MEMSNRVHNAMDDFDNAAKKKLDAIEKRKPFRKPFMPSIVKRSQKDWQKKNIDGKLRRQESSMNLSARIAPQWTGAVQHE